MTSRFAHQFLNQLTTLAGAAFVLGSVACSSAPGVEANFDEGRACAADDECYEGEYCGADGLCTSDCGADAACPDGQVCRADGRCIEGSGTETPTNTENPPVDIECVAENTCVAGGVTLGNSTPTIVLLVDQSGSMNDDLNGSAESRWELLRSALIDENDGILKSLENDVRFGLALYSNDRKVSQCPMLTEVATKFGNFDDIRSVYQAATPQKDTPTAESLELVAQQLAVYDAPGPKAIILATDGRPDNCADPDAHDQGSRDMSIAAAQNAFADGITTHVISVGTDVGHEHLGDMANAGSGVEIGGTAQAPYYEVTQQGQLKAALEDVIAGVRSCVFSLDGDVDASEAAEGTVWIDGNEIPYDQTNGWRLNSSREIALVGDACDLVKNGSHEVKAEFPCPCEAPTPEIPEVR